MPHGVKKAIFVIVMVLNIFNADIHVPPLTTVRPPGIVDASKSKSRVPSTNGTFD
jgi:hypothetical protein